MIQKTSKGIPEMGAKTFENEKMVDFLRSLTKGATLFSPLFGYMKVYETNASGVEMDLPNLGEDEAYTPLFRYNGRLACFEKGECMLFLSHLYRRWDVLNFQPGDIVAMDIKYKDGNIQTYVMFFCKVESTDYPKIITYACLCKNSDVLTFYALLDLYGTCAEKESIELRYATPTEKKLLNNAVEKFGKRWDNVTQSLMPLDSEIHTSEQMGEKFNALLKEYNRLTEHCIKLEHERDEALKKAERVYQLVDDYNDVVHQLNGKEKRKDEDPSKQTLGEMRQMRDLCDKLERENGELNRFAKAIHSFMKDKALYMRKATNCPYYQDGPNVCSTFCLECDSCLGVIEDFGVICEKRLVEASVTFTGND